MIHSWCIYELFIYFRYLDYIKELVFSSLSQAKLGGVPSTLNLVHSYLTLKQANSFPGFEVGIVIIII